MLKNAVLKKMNMTFSAATRKLVAEDPDFGMSHGMRRALTAPAQILVAQRMRCYVDQDDIQRLVGDLYKYCASGYGEADRLSEDLAGSVKISTLVEVPYPGFAGIRMRLYRRAESQPFVEYVFSFRRETGELGPTHSVRE